MRVVCVVVVECVGRVEHVAGGRMRDGAIGGGYGMEVSGAMSLYVKSTVMFSAVWNTGHVHEMLPSRSTNGLSGLGPSASGPTVFLSRASKQGGNSLWGEKLM